MGHGFNRPEASGEGQKNFLKLKDKESIIGVLVGQPYWFYQKWINGKPGGPLAEYEQGAQFRFRINFVCKEPTTGALVSKIFEQGSTVFDQLNELLTEYGNKQNDLSDIYVKITRKGSTKSDTSYTIIPMLKQKVNTAQLATVKLQEIEHAPKANGAILHDDIQTLDEPESFMNEDDNIPF